MAHPPGHKTPAWAMALVLAMTLFTATAQGLFKTGAARLPELFPNLALWSGFVLYGIAFMGLMKGLKHGELSVLYPLIALSFVWVVIISSFYFGEAIGVLKILGIAGIIMGISLIGWGSARHARRTA